MSRPDTLLQWATSLVSGYPGRVEPNSGKKSSGFDDGEAPAASEHNWLFGLAGDWIAYFDDAITSLFDLVPNIALKTLSNGFSVGQQINPLSATDALISSTVLPGSAIWLQVLQVPCDATRTLRLYYGASDSGGLAALVVNAHWNPGTHLWAAEDITKDSVALMLRRHPFTGQLRLAVNYRAAAAGTWATWSYAVRQTPINVLDFTVLAGGWAVGPVSGAPESAAPSDEMVYAIRLPHGAQFNRLHILHTQTTTTPNEFNVYARNKTDWPAIGAVTPPALALPAHGPSETRATVIGPGSIAVTPPAYSVTSTVFNIDNNSDTLVLDCLAGAAGNAVLAAMIEWVDY